MIKKHMSSGIGFVVAMLCFSTCQASAFMSKQAQERIDAQVAAVRAKVEKQAETDQKQAVLRTAFAQAQDPYVKENILTMAVALGGPELERLLLGVLKNDPDVRLRITAVDALANHGSPDAIQPLLNCAENDPEGEAGWACISYQATARQNAYFALSEIGLRHPAASNRIAESITALRVTAENLQDPKIQAIYILTRDRARLKPFFERLQSEDTMVRVRGVVGFRFLKLTEAPEKLVALLNDPDAVVRTWVALVLGEIGDPDTIPRLIAAAKDKQEDRGVRCNAIHSLGHMRAKQAEPVLRELLTDENVKVNAAISLSQLTGERHPLVPQGYSLD